MMITPNPYTEYSIGQRVVWKKNESATATRAGRIIGLAVYLEFDDGGEETAALRHYSHHAPDEPPTFSGVIAPEALGDMTDDQLMAKMKERGLLE